MKELFLKTPSSEGKITVGKHCAASRLPELTGGQKNFVVTDENVFALYRKFFAEHFGNAEIYVLPAGEKSKSFENLGKILQRMTEAELHRSSRLFAVGGGVVGDIGGLAAALYMRGISCVQVPTTLLAQVDSSVGGKTAVDLGGVKNVVGAFYQPCETLVDSVFLDTLPPRELKCGLGEIVKYAALDGGIFDELEENASELCEKEFLYSLVFPCIAHKAEVVEADEKETGERRSLNVGHTTGHAVELASGLSHGESVLWGMLFETELAIKYGVCEREYGRELLRLVERALAVSPTAAADFSRIEKDAEKARSDKKNSDDGNIRMSVGRAKGEWTMFSLPFEEYRNGLAEIVRKRGIGGNGNEND